MIEINYLAMIDCDYNVIFNDVQILYIYIIYFWIELVTRYIYLQMSYFHFLFVMVHINIKLGDNSV
jgi:hypothetical protein